MRPKHPIDQRTAFWFGVSLSGACFVAAAIAAWRDLSGVWVGAGTIAGGALLVLNACVPAVRGPVYRSVQYLTYPIHVVVTFVLLAIVFYLLVTPLGLVLRLRGRDTMNRRPGSRRPASQWHQRDGETEPQRYFKMF